MPVESDLREDGQVSYFKLTDPWTLEELFKGFAQATALRDSIHEKYPNRKVHTLLDMMATKTAPPGVMKGRKMPSMGHPTRGEMVVAVKHEFPRTIVQAMLKVMHADAHFVESIDEAWDYLHGVIQKSSVNVDTDAK
jgi:hypothetical protein